MKSQVSRDTAVSDPVDSVASTRRKKYCSAMVSRRVGWFTLFALLLTLLASCVGIPVSSKTTANDKLQSLDPLQPGDVLVVYGDSAPPRKEAIFIDYFSAYCLHGSGRDITSYLIENILKFNPRPGMFAVKPLRVVSDELSTTIKDGRDCVDGPLLCKLGLSKAEVLSDHLRYAVYVREEFQSKLHLPLFAAPFGIASCGHKTVLKADVWELKTNQHAGTLTVSAKGEETVAAYLVGVGVARDTQKDATEKLARELVKRLTGLKPLEVG